MSENKNLYQKKHGLPGVPMSSGEDGQSYNDGVNVHVGYINEFFNTVDVPVVNLVRVAQKDTSNYYTGIYKIADNEYIDQSTYTDSSVLNMNIYKPISDFNTVDKYPLSYAVDQMDSSTYTKVDVAVGPNDSSLDPKSYWNTDVETSSFRWKQDITMVDSSNNSSVYSGMSFEESGYGSYDPNILIDSSMLHISDRVGSTQGNKYFSIIKNDTNYIFSTLNEKMAQEYTGFIENESQGRFGMESTTNSIYIKKRNYILDYRSQTVEVEFSTSSDITQIQLTSNATSWLKIYGGNGQIIDSSAGKFKFTVSKNETPTSRSGQINVVDRNNNTNVTILYITQKEDESVIYLTVENTSRTLEWDTDLLTIDFKTSKPIKTAYATVQYYSYDTNFITILDSYDADVTTKQCINFSLSENRSGKDRTAVIIIQSPEAVEPVGVYITQKSLEYIDIPLKSLSFGFETETVQVPFDYTDSLVGTLETNETTWVQASISDNISNKYISITCSENTTQSVRQFDLIITSKSNPTIEGHVLIVQDWDSSYKFNILDNEYMLSEHEQDFNIKFSDSGIAKSSIYLEPTDKVSDEMFGGSYAYMPGTGPITINVSRNTTGNTRTGKLLIYGDEINDATITVVQLKNWIVIDNYTYASAEGGVFYIPFICSDDVKNIAVGTYDEWPTWLIDAYDWQASDNTVITYAVEENTSYVPRYLQLTLTYNDPVQGQETVYVAVTQYPSTRPTINVFDSYYLSAFNQPHVDIHFSVDGNLDVMSFSVQDDNGMISSMPDSWNPYDGNDYIRVNLNTNTTGADKYATIQFICENAFNSPTIEIVQFGSQEIFTFTPHPAHGLGLFSILNNPENGLMVTHGTGDRYNIHSAGDIYSCAKTQYMNWIGTNGLIIYNNIDSEMIVYDITCPVCGSVLRVDNNNKTALCDSCNHYWSLETGISTGTVPNLIEYTSISKYDGVTGEYECTYYIISNSTTTYSLSAPAPKTFGAPNTMGTSSTEIPSLKDLIENIQDESTEMPLVNYIKYDKNAIESLQFTDKLSSSIKTGDVIYFYTNPDKFAVDKEIEYMVVITPELVGATLTQLLTKAIPSPLTYKYTQTGTIKDKEYIISEVNCVSVEYDSSTNDNDKTSTYGKNFVNLVSQKTKSSLVLGAFSNKKGDTYSNELKQNFIVLNPGKKDTNMTFSYAVINDEDTDMPVKSESIIKASSGTSYDEKTLSLKMNDLYIKNNNFGNVEMNRPALNYLELETSGHLSMYLFNENFDASTDTFTIDKSLFVIDGMDYSNLQCGYELIRFCQVDALGQPEENPKFIIDTDYKESAFENHFITSDITKVPLDRSKYFEYDVVVGVEYKDNDLVDKIITMKSYCSYMIRLWAFDENGTKHISHKTFAVFNPADKQFKLYTPYIETSEETTETDDSIKFSFSGLSVDTVSSENPLTMSIEVPADVSECNVYVNSKKINQNFNYKNSWLTVNNFMIDENNNDETTVKYTMNVIVENNLPSVYQTDVHTTEEYNAMCGTSNMIEGCELFNAIMNNETLDTELRTANITVVYKLYGVEHRSHYTIEQPGYIENRKIPKVNLNINKELVKLEESNKLSNGVMCNQYQFFIDVDIEDFSKDEWGTYVDSDNITLNFEIANAAVDDDFIEKYAIYSTEDTYTVHVNTVDNKEDNKDNYISIKTTVVDSTSTDVYNTTQRALDENYENLISNDVSINISESVITSDFTTEASKLIVGNETKNIVMTSPEMFENPYVRKTGINNQTLIKFENIKFSDAGKQFKIRVVVEYGNPMFSRLFFKYYVSNMYVQYTDANGKKTNFYVGKNNLHISKTGTYSETEYMFSTNTLNAFVCPVSFTTIPFDESMTSINGNVKLTGSDKQITLKTDSYCGPVNIMLSHEEILKEYVENQIVPWNQFSLKKRYLQDSVSKMNIMPIHISDYYDKLSKYELFGASVENNYTYEDVMSEQKDHNYMSVVYHSGLYNSMMRDDMNSFIYNDNVLPSSQYDQFINEAPAYAPAEMIYELRSDMAVSSIKVWNDEFDASKQKDEHTFRGILSNTGNGYNYLTDESDFGQYNPEQEAWSLMDTRLYNEQFIFDGAYECEAPQTMMNSINHPNSKYWFRSLLYNVKWQYPKYYNDDNTQSFRIQSFDIVHNGKYYRDVVQRKDGSDMAYELPYNIMYSIYPRCAYNDEDDVAIIFMLRCPSVVRENQYTMTYKDVMIPTLTEDIYNDNQISNDQNISL